MNEKIRVTAAELFALLDREFRRRRPPICEECYVQLPYRVDVPRGQSPNWEVMLPPHCAHDCRRVIDQVVEDLAPRYELMAD